MGKSRKTYEENFKRNVVKLYESGTKVSELKLKYNLSESAVYKWIDQYSTKATGSSSTDSTYSSNDIKEMEARIRELEEDNEILKKAMTIFANK